MSTSAKKRENALKQARDSLGHFVSVSDGITPKPSDRIIDIKVTHPWFYVKNWWKKTVGSQAVTIKIPLVPAIALTLILLGITSFGSFTMGVQAQIRKTFPIVSDIFPDPTAIPTPNPWKVETFIGKLAQYSNDKNYYLVLNNDNPIKLEVPATVEISKLVGKNILAIGFYNPQTRIMKVTEAGDLTIVSSYQAVPTSMPTAIPQY